MIDDLYQHGIQSLIVEGGRQTHESFISSGLWDESRVETAPFVVSGGTRAPQLPTDILLYNKVDYNGNTITFYRSQQALLPISEFPT